MKHAVFVELAAKLAKPLGASPRDLDRGDTASIARAIDGRHLVLLRDHGHAVSVSLPTESSWSWRTREDIVAQLPDVARCVAAYRVRYPDVVSLADAIVAIAKPWAVSFPGTPIPSECWLDGGRVGLFQEGTSVRVVVWVGKEMKSIGARTAADLARIGPWLEPVLVAQATAAAAAAVEERREDEARRARGIPSLDAVLAAMRAGRRFTCGRGRYTETYFIEGAQVRCEIQDEGHHETVERSVADLTADIGRHPDDFRP